MAKKTKRKSAPKARRPIAKKVVGAMRRETTKQVISLSAFREGVALADSLQESVVSPESLSEFHPAHAYYVATQNQASVWTDMLAGMPECARLSRLVGESEEEYMPDGPPMSPLTTSFWTCWAFFDACVGLGRETFGTTILAVGKAAAMPSGLLNAISIMQASRMGVFVHAGESGEYVLLRELVTDRVFRSIPTSGYGGERGELWSVRLLPPPSDAFDAHVVFTTPYILQNSEETWLKYFDRSLPESTKNSTAYERHLKWGPSRRYWNEFVLEAYAGHQHDAIFLSGVPDIPESLPHSESFDDKLRDGMS